MTLKLLAQDADDLTILSAALQDAVGKIGDIAFDGRARTLTLALNRFRWENRRGGERVRTGLQINGVLSVQTRNVRRGAKDAVVALLAIGFEAGDAPGGAIILTLAGGGDIRAEVECVDAVLADISDAWPARHKPGHV